MNKEHLSITLDIGAKITAYEQALNRMQQGLNALHLPDNLDKSIKNIFDNYTDEISNLKQLTEDAKLTPINERDVKNSIARIDKLYKDLISKMSTKGYQTSMLEKDYQALQQMVAAEQKYSNTIGEINKQLAAENRELDALNEKLVQQRANAKNLKEIAAKEKETFKQKSAEASKVNNQLEKQQKIYDDIYKKQEDYKKLYAESREDKTARGWNNTQEGRVINDQRKEAEEELNRILQESITLNKEKADAETRSAEAAKQVSQANKALANSERATQAKIQTHTDTIAELNAELSEVATKTFKEIQQSLLESGIDWSEYKIDPETLNSYEALKQALEQVAQVGGNNTVQALNAIAEAMRDTKNAGKDLSQGVGAARDSLKDLTDQAQDVERMRQSILRFFSVSNAIRLFKRAIKSAFNTIKDLDKVMTETAVVTNFSVADMWKQLPEYTARANKLGVTIHDVYEASTLYYQQGLKTNEVMQLTNATLKMARIASLDAAEATDRMTNALRGFNMELNEENADRVADVYSKLAAISASNVDEISTAMTKVASLASNANMQFETTAAFLAQIIETTRESAETAGTALKTVVARFSEVKNLYSQGELLGTDEEGEAIDVNKVSKALRTAGIDLNEYLTGVKGLDDIFLELAQKWDSLDRVQQRYIATMAAGSRQQSRFIAMMQDYKRTTELVSAANNAAGASNEQYQKTLDSLESKLNKLKNSWNTFLMDLTNSTTIKIAVDTLNLLITALNKISAVLPGVIASLGKMWLAFSAAKGVRALFGKNGEGLSLIEKILFDIGDNKTKTGLASFPTILGRVTGQVGVSLDKLRKKIGNFKSDGALKSIKNIIVGDASTGTGLAGSFSKGATDMAKAAGLADASLTSILGPIAAVAAAVAALVIVIKAIKAASPEAQLEKIKQELTEANDIATRTKETYSELKDSFASLEEQTNTLNSLKKGTTEWRDSLLSVNKQVLDLIEKYPKLVSAVRYDKDSLYFENTDAILQEYQKQSIISNLAVLNTQTRLQQAQSRVARSNTPLKLRDVGNLETIAQLFASGQRSSEDIENIYKKANIQINNDDLVKLREYGNTLNQINNTTRTLNQAFIDTIKTLNDWTPEEEKAADYVVEGLDKFINVSKLNTTFEMQKMYGFDKKEIEKYYQDNIDPNAILIGVFKKKLSYTENGITQEIDISAAHNRVERETVTKEKQNTVEALVPKIAKLSEKTQRLLFAPDTLTTGETFDITAIEKEISYIPGLADILKDIGKDIKTQIQLYDKNTPQVRDTTTKKDINKATDLDASDGGILDQISNEAFALIAKNAEDYGEIISNIFELTKDPQKFSDLISTIFNENFDLHDLDSINKLKEQILSMDTGIENSQIFDLFDKIIAFTKAVSLTSVDKLKSNITTGEGVIEAAQTGTAFEDKQYSFAIKAGIPDTDFIMTAAGWVYIGDPNKLITQIQQYNATEFDNAVVSWNNNPTDQSTNEQLAQSAQVMGAAGQNIDVSNLQHGFDTTYDQAYGGAISALEEYSKGLIAAAEGNEELYLKQQQLQQSLKNGTREAQSEARALLKLGIEEQEAQKKFDKLNDTIEDNADILKEGDENSVEYKIALSKVGDAMSDIFGQDFDEEFLTKNLGDIQAFAEGDEEAFNRLQKTINDRYIESMKQAVAEGSASQAQLEGISDAVDTLNGKDFSINGEADCTDVFTELMKVYNDAEATAQAIEALGGYQVTWDQYEDEEGNIQYKAKVANTMKQAQQRNFSSGGRKKSSGGGSKEKEKYWDNPYDELYNLLEAQNELLRTREKLEREYDRILAKRTSTVDALKQNSLDEIANLQKELDIQRQIQEGRVRMMNELGAKGTYRNEEGQEKTFNQWGVTKYGGYDKETGQMWIDWDAIDRVNDPELGGAIEAYISKLEELSQSFEETQETIEEMEDLVREIKERNMQEYLEFEERVYEAIINREQKVIDEYSALSDTISESNSRIIDNLRESIDLERQIRDNTKTEEDIADKEARLAYLQRDTSGANQQEILKLQQELDDARQSYGDTLIDQAIDQLEQENQRAEEQRQQQIEIMQAQLDWQDKNGEFWPEVYALLQDSYNKGMLDDGSPLVQLLEESDTFSGLSQFGQKDWMNKLFEEWIKANEGKSNWESQQMNANGTTQTDTSSETAPLAEHVTPTGGNRTPAPVEEVVTSAKGNISSAGAVWPNEKKADMKKLQAGINDLIRDGVITGIDILVEDGIRGPLTTAAIKKLQALVGTNVDGKWGKNSLAAFKQSSISAYKTGGLVNSTGLAWLDGTKSSPELVLSAADTENFIALKNALAQMLAQSKLGGKAGGDNYFDIQINVDELANDYDVDQLAARIKKQIYDDSTYRNVNAISYIR